VADDANVANEVAVVAWSGAQGDLFAGIEVDLD